MSVRQAHVLDQGAACSVTGATSTGSRVPTASSTPNAAGPAIRVIIDFLERFYNPRRRHSALRMRSPLAFEADHRAAIVDDRGEAA